MLTHLHALGSATPITTVANFERPGTTSGTDLPCQNELSILVQSADNVYYNIRKSLEQIPYYSRGECYKLKFLRIIYLQLVK